ncbi:Nucleoporin GLE1 [Yarrowia sp. C11]|nr:Nucleoporin GLE1 [Yarrowia sp. E02]KAG5371682.1 Nucleoporin GLE1 [Yarrowia sp. C11]
MRFSPLRPAVLSRLPNFDDGNDPLWDDEELSQEISQYEISLEEEGTPSKPPRKTPSQSRFATEYSPAGEISPTRSKQVTKPAISSPLKNEQKNEPENTTHDLSSAEWEGTLNRVSLILDQCHLSPVGNFKRGHRRGSSVKTISLEPASAAAVIDWGAPLAKVEQELQHVEDVWAAEELKRHNDVARRESVLMSRMGDDRLKRSDELAKRREKRNSVIVGDLVDQWEAEKREEERKRLEAERLEKERIERERAEAERVRKEKEEAERVAREKAEKEKKEKERLEKERLEKERLEKEKAAKEKAEKEEKERLEAEELARKNKQGQYTNWRAVDKEFLEWKAKIEQIKKEVKEPVANDPEVKKFCNQSKRKLNPKFGQLTPSIKHTKEISEEFVEIINDARNHSKLVYLWLLNFFAKSIVRQAENETIVAPQSALPLGMLSAKIMSVFPELTELLVARFVKKCPFVIGFTCDIDTEQGRERMAWRKPGGKWEDETVYSERMGGIASVYAAITQIRFTAPALNPRPMSCSWTMIARLLNTETEKLTNAHFTVAASWWEVIAVRFLATYGIQGRKMLQAAWDPWTASCGEKRFPAGARLRLMGEEWHKTGDVKGIAPMTKV